MRKQFLLLFIIIINVSISSQVVIKDEIILYETENPDEENLTMPFYGKVEGTVPWGSVFWNYFKRVEIEAGGQIVARGCPCNGCGVFNGNWVINNLPVATPVVVRAYTHCVNGDFVEGVTRLINTGTNEWSIEVFSYNFQIWTQATTLKFIETTPPGNCPNAGGNYCDSSSWVQIPDIELAPYSGNTANFINYHCSDVTNRLAFFSPFTFHISSLKSLSSSDVIACYNQSLQRWQFNLNQNLELYYVVAVCAANIASRNIKLINSLNDIDSIPLNECGIALKSFQGHKAYPYEIDNGGYAITEALLFHENGHKDKFDEFKDSYFFAWESEINIFNESCSTYSDIFQAKEGGLKMFNKSFDTYYETFKKEHDKLIGLKPKNDILKTKEEKRVNNRPEMHALVDRYVDALKIHCGI